MQLRDSDHGHDMTMIIYSFETFVEAVSTVRIHDFIAKKQSEYFKNKKNNLQSGEVLVVADFSENYSFLLQDSAQGFH